MSLAMVGGRLAVAAGDFSLCLSECLLRDDSLVVILYVILRQLAGIFLGYACQYILDKCLLQQHITAVFLVLENPLDALGRPLLVATCSEYAVSL